MGAQKPLILHWLVGHLNAETYPGVSWLNQERTRFRIPWKHGSRHSVGPEDFQLFEGWAIASGRYIPGAGQRTPSEWKRNFRSALNRKPEIKMVEDKSTDAENPHKVFEIQSMADVNSCAVEERNTVADDLSPIQVTNLGAYGDSSSSSQDETLESLLSSLDPFSPGEVLGAENPFFVGASLPPSDLNLAPLPAPPADIVLPWEEVLRADKFETDFEVRAYYRGRLVFNQVFSGVQGLCFRPAGSPGPYPGLADVGLPDPSTFNDSLQVTFTNRLLQGLLPGVLLHVDGMSLCGSRQGHCSVYWSHSEMPAADTPCGEFPKREFAPLYNLHQFVQELIGYLEGQNGSPDYTLWLCFGEVWPDTTRPWKKKLIMVQVIPKAFEMLYDLSQACGASSLRDGVPDLRISDSLQESHFLAKLKEFEERMEVQLTPQTTDPPPFQTDSTLNFRHA
ncbi:interferon regulatory factor 3 [Hemicordylus capensis]|uniref:interferon regulatory factor 3 n=1 Tax=Hemicordylus capensis TaxID=884348 RepID=UPI0023036018|nr:interferon regulatory factor 3 [Hemicordylus capensis]XP_053114732.1 interferon regulatory factor 3 [Hemicordylus capensis]